MNKYQRLINTIHSDKWIDYKDKEVLVIKEHSRGNVARFQYNGTSCSQGYTKGFVVKSFTTTSRWFNPDWWYKKPAGQTINQNYILKKMEK